jgi:Putative MetA-pathway of phenol degradation
MRSRYIFAAILLSGCFSIFLCAFNAWAGPPFVTDDPEPVEFRHWEVYLASVYNHGSDGTTGTAPQLEVNCGIAHETQLHLIAPAAYTDPSAGPSQYGLGDMELGVKYRFLHETASTPQAGVFPLAELPSGDSSLGLGAGHTAVFLPVWLQKSFGKWTTYAGGGYWFNKTSSGDSDYWQAGWELQRDISKVLTLGAEIFFFSPKTEGGPRETGLNAGAIINFSEEHHLLFSLGGDSSGHNAHFAYAAFQWTTGSGDGH